jgi:inositol-phosphate phosphatase/L-galactose 1-phosphate phosphatase/histidinol-phosphatase
LTEPFDPAFGVLAHRLADTAGTAAMELFRTNLAIETKDDDSPVTLADRDAEAAMRALINEAFPEHGILGEEHGAERTDSEFVWVLDPIDGTRAFINGIPLFATLIALVRDGDPVLGLNAYPALDERWMAVRGGPALHWGRGETGKACRVRACPSLAAARACTTSPDMFDEADGIRYARLKPAMRDVRFGTDAWAYAMVASGETDLAVESGMQPYDYLSHAVIVESAGGTITDWEGLPLRIDSPGSVLAAGDSAVHAAALGILTTDG